MTKTFTAVAFLLALTGAAPCQSASVRDAAPPFVLEPGEYGMAKLIDRAAEYLHCNILYEPNELEGTGKIRLGQRAEVTGRGCWELFSALLHHKGLALIPLDAEHGLHEVISMRGPRAGEITARAVQVPSGEIEAYAKLPATPILTSVDLQNTNAAIVTNALRPFFARAGGNSGLTLGTGGNNRSILLQGFGAEVAAAYHLVQLVDRNEVVAGKMQVVRLEHAAAEEMVAMIEEVLVRRIQQQAAESGMPMLSGGSALRAIAQPNTNSLVLGGGEDQLREALELIARLDVPAAPEARNPRPAGGVGERRTKVGDGKTAPAAVEPTKTTGGD